MTLTMQETPRRGSAIPMTERAIKHAKTLPAGTMVDVGIELTERDRNRIFNLGYYTWVEQQGTPLDVFEARRSQTFWRQIRAYMPVWDTMIDDFNARVAAQ